MLSAEASSAICVQRFDDSRNSAIHTTYRISLRSSSLREPRYPLLRVILVTEVGRTSRTRPHSYLTSGKLCWECKVGQKPGSLNESRPYHVDQCTINVIQSARSLTLVRINRPESPRLIRPSKSNKRSRIPRPIGTVKKGGFTVCCGIDRFNDPSAGSPTETLLRLLLPLSGRV